MHVDDERVHHGQRLVGLVDDEVGALGHDGEVVVGDEGGDLDDDVAGRVEAGHLEVHPHQHGGDCTRAYARPVLDLPVIRLDPDLPLPTYARDGDAGLDLLARDDVVLAARRGAGAGADRGGRRHPRGPRRLRAAPQRPGPAPRRDAA